MNLSRAVKALAEKGVPDPASDVRRLFDWAYEIGQSAPESQSRDTPNDLTLEMFGSALAERARRRPVSQIIGRRAFWRHDFVVTPDVLDPRPETESLVAAALEQPFARLLDLGTGTGCILISLLADRPSAQGVGTDLSDAALEVARRNAGRLGVAERARFLRSDWFSAVQGKYDLIVSNPPYLAEAEIAGLAPEVRDWEPRGALTPGGDGLGAYRAIAAGAGARLMAGGRLILEIGPAQAGAVAGLLVAQGFPPPEIRRDLDGRDRVVVAVMPGDDGACGAA